LINLSITSHSFDIGNANAKYAQLNELIDIIANERGMKIYSS